jgi:hypothetical protein
MSLGVFQSKIYHGNESRKIWLFAAMTFISLIFHYEILNAKYVEVKNPNFFRLCSVYLSAHTLLFSYLFIYGKGNQSKGTLSFVALIEKI